MVVIGVDRVIPEGRRLGRLVDELHPRLLGDAPSFAMVTVLAGADHVVPIMLAAAVARHNVIQC